jgi:hypothetical protein
MHPLKKRQRVRHPVRMSDYFAMYSLAMTNHGGLDGRLLQLIRYINVVTPAIVFW